MIIKRLCIIIAVLYVGIIMETDAVENLGKIANGISFVNATNDKRILAHELALVLLGKSTNHAYHNASTRVASAFKKAMLETGMEADELAFELLYWPQDSSRTNAIRFDINLDYQDDRVATSAVQKLVAAANRINARNAWTRWTRERAIVNSVGKLSEIDSAVAKILSGLDNQIASIDSSLPQAEQLQKKVQYISDAIAAIQKSDTNVDFDSFLDTERATANARVDELAAKEPRLADHKPVIKSGLDHGREYEAVQVAKKAKDELIAGMTTHVNSLLKDINSLLQRQTHSTQETQTDPTPSVAVTMSEMGTQAVPQTADQSTQTDLIGQDIDQLQRNLVAKQAEITQQQAENNQLRKEVDNRKEAAERIDRERLFEKYLLGLLTRALTGVDYTKPDESDPEIYRNTVLSTAKGSGAKPHNREIKGRFSNDGLRIDHWKQANECIRSCICSIMAGLNQNLESIKSDINKACEQLPTSKLDDETVRIGLTLQKILETVTVYEVDDRSLPPIDDVDQKVKEEVQRRSKE